MKTIARTVLLVALVSTVSLPLHAKDEGQDKAPRTLLEHFRAEMEKIRFEVINAGARIKGGAVSMGLDEGVADTPANRCCSGNVVRIGRHLANLVPIWKGLNACYQGTGDDNAIVPLNFVHTDTGSLVQAYENFRGATESQLLGGHQAMTKAFFLLEQSLGDLPECGDKVPRPQAEP